jgi:hypothetical protein
MPTGQGKTWNAHRVSSLRRVRGIHAYRSAEKNGEWLTLSEAAAHLGVSHHQVRRLIKTGILTTEQVMPGAPGAAARLEQHQPQPAPAHPAALYR